MLSPLEGNNSLNKKYYRKEIDGLRAFAIVTVIINHFNKDLLPGGYLGVDMFFVISGFVITSSLSKRQNENFKDFIIGFYERRFKRLVPALSVFVIIVSILICLFNPFPSVSLRTGLTSLFGISNLYLIQQSTDYFSQSTELNVFTQTWSLGVEEQFYLLFPFLVWFSGYSRQTRNGSRNLFLSVGILSVTSVIGFLYLYPTNQVAAYFLMPSRFWEIATGCLVFLLLQKRNSIEESLKRIPTFLLLISIITVMFVPTAWATLSTILVVGLTSILIASLKKKTAVYKIFTKPIIVYVGLISYSLYLWHWAVLSLSRWTIGIHWWSSPFQLLIMFVLAIASYEWIEKPLRSRLWFQTRFNDFMFGIKLLIIASLSLVALGRPLKGKLYVGNKNNKSNIEGFGETKIIKDPSFPTIFLIGDSHAGHYGAAMTYLATKNDFNFIMHPQGEGLKLTNESKEEHVLAPLRKYRNIFKKGDMIIFSSSIGKYKLDGEFTKVYKTFLQKTKNIEMKYFLISPTPEFSKVKKGDTCQEEWYRPSWAISSSCFAEVKKSEWLASEKEPILLIQKFLLANPNVFYIDSFSILCPNDNCKNHDQNSFIYKDAHHLTSYGAMQVSKIIEKNLLAY